MIVGFDSAWTAGKSGALVGAVRHAGKQWRWLGPPIQADFLAAEQHILEWQAAESPTTTLILLDQPTIVWNETGQRPVESIVASSISRRYGGVQPANTGRTEMFGREAPVWRFLNRFNGPEVLAPLANGTHVLETYPVLAMIALDWTLADKRSDGRLPKYNPERKKTFRISDWQHVCLSAASLTKDAGLDDLSAWLAHLCDLNQPRKRDQGALDACLCLVVALNFISTQEYLFIGNLETGYIVVPYSTALKAELNTRCIATRRVSSEWLQRFRLYATE